KPQPWQPSDSLVIAGYMYETLSDTSEEEFNRAKVTAKVGWERARDLFSADATMDHFVVGDPNTVNDGSQRSHVHPGDEDDEDDDMESDGVLKAKTRTGTSGDLGFRDFPDLTAALAGSIVNSLAETGQEVRRALGSNNWVVGGSHTATGKPLL